MEACKQQNYESIQAAEPWIGVHVAIKCIVQAVVIKIQAVY